MMQTATVVAMLLAFFSVGAAPATAPATRPAAETLGFEQVMAQTAYEKIMADAVGAIADFDLDPTQKEQLLAAEKAHQDNLAAMRKRHDVKAIEADTRETMRQAALAGGNADPAMLQRSLQTHEPFHRDALAVQQQYRRSLLEILTPQQRLKWQAVPLRAEINARLNGVKLAADQNSKMDTICRSFAEAMMQAPDGRYEQHFWQFRNTVWKFACEKILTAEQRKQAAPASLEEELQRQKNR